MSQPRNYVYYRIILVVPLLVTLGRLQTPPPKQNLKKKSPLNDWLLGIHLMLVGEKVLYE